MKVILEQFVRGVGAKGDIVEVSDGYAQNALIPRKLARPATRKAVNEAQQKKAHKEQSVKQKTLQDQKTLTMLNGKTLTIKAKANEQGVLYQSLGLREVIRAVHESLQLSTSNDLYQDAYAFKEIGDYQLTLQSCDAQATLHLSIEG